MLTELLGSATRARLLATLVVQPERRFYLRELMRITGFGASSVQRELAHLERIGVLLSEREGSNRYFRADPAYPLAGELSTFVQAGLAAEPAPLGAAGAVSFNPAVADKLPTLAAACRRRGVERLAVFGSALTADAAVVPNDLDLVVTFGHMLPEARGRAYLDLMRELEDIMGMRVDIVIDGSVRNPYLRQAIDDTRVVLYDAA